MNRFDLITVHTEFDTYQEMQPSPIGSWVKYNDIADLETDLLRLQNENKKLLDFISKSGLEYKDPIVLEGEFVHFPVKTHPGRIYGTDATTHTA